MGIKELWPFLNPYCVRKPLYELQGKTVAIDLAGWICESLCVVDYEVSARFYLRNLFFRTCYLLLSGITPVFVLDGTAPVLKHQTISKRNQIQFRGAKPRKEPPPATQAPQSQPASTQVNTQKASKGRTRFNYVLKQCEELIRSMGLQCVQGPGEAEAFCAHLNAAGLVDGVISQDSDCFAYGARRVFRNFSLSMQGTAGSIGGSIDIYDLDFIQKSVDFGRNKIIVMALLCGCDYCPEGVGGVGRDAVHKLFGIYSDEDILERIRMWRKNDNKFTELEMKVDDKSLCVNCGHYGRVQSHTKGGCAQCRMTIGCDSSIWKEKRLALKSELQIRKKAMQSDDFPSEEIIDEFMQVPIDMSPLQLDWGQPNVVKFVKMMGKLIQWDEIYCFQKFLPLLTRWQLHHADDDTSNVILRGCVQPDFIKKKRTPKGVPSYEIIWKDEQGCFHALIPDEQLRMFYSTNKEKTETEAFQLLWSTIEPIDLVEKAYPELVNAFEESKSKGKSKKTKKSQETAIFTKGRKVKNVVALEKQVISEKAPKKVISRTAGVKSKKKNDENTRPIDVFFRKKPATGMATVYSSPKIKTTTKPMNLSAFNDSLTSLEQDDMNISAIVSEMVSRPPNVTEFNGKKLKFDAIKLRVNDDLMKDMSGMKENCKKSKEVQKNAVVETKAAIGDENNESIDEFDLIVMQKMRKSLGRRQKSILASSSNDATKLANCSTPVSRSHNWRVNESLKQSPDLSFVLETSINRKNAVISSSFFAVNPEDEVDLFEKSIDFRNMQDAGNDEESDSPHNSDSLHDDDSPSGTTARTNQLNEDDVDVDENDTFDRLVGIV